MIRKKDKYMKNYTMLISGLLLAFNMATAQEPKLPSVQTLAALVERDGKLYQPVTISLDYKGEPADASLQIGEAAATQIRLTTGVQRVEGVVPAVEKESQVQVRLTAGDKELVSQVVTLKPVRKMTVYVVPHSHTDIGFTEIQTAIEKKQVDNLLEGIALAKKTADYPAGSRFIWSVEVLWAADLYQRRLNDQQRADFVEAVKKGQVAVVRYVLERADRTVPTGGVDPAVPLFHKAG